MICLHKWIEISSSAPELKEVKRTQYAKKMINMSLYKKRCAKCGMKLSEWKKYNCYGVDKKWVLLDDHHLDFPPEK